MICDRVICFDKYDIVESDWGGYLLLASILAGFEPTVVDSFRRYDDIPVRCGLFIDKSRAEVENQRVSGFSDAVPSSLLGSESAL
jgi:hypothetical protein